MNNSSFAELKSIIESKKKVLVVSHYNPDGDAIGSSFAFANFLNLFGIEAHVYNLDKVPNYLDFLKTLNFHNSIKTIPNDIDLYVIVDFNDLERSGNEMMNYLERKIKEKKPLILIDHHENNKVNYGHRFIDTSASSTGVLIYKLLAEFDQEINSEISTALLTTIITDTSSYKNSNVNTDSFYISAELIKSKADIGLINRNIYKLGNINALQLRNKIHGTLHFIEEHKLAICYSLNDFYNQTRTTKEDSEGIANGLIFYNNVEVGVFIREIKENSWKVSMRTNNYINLSKFAQVFGGGGHKNASGFTYTGKLENLIEKLIENMKNESDNCS
ncbi:bifunctional oligoribonuclease/PAP phosphatase NrnA [bacterium]|nr:bifunctional oligoribonuclease/PAP phosphatase NrnA [bacterium]|tara:strand:+ start:43346 stop:44338 length:993 start_codon:yes stop_codon:yes gene_type:complete